jgi:hypothetical protein
MLGSLILGAGPGGTGPLVWAAQQGCLHEWLRQGVAVIERGSAIGGTLGRYIINSDSLGAAYLECLDAPPARRLFAPLRCEAATQELERLRDGFPPLSLVGHYLGHLGALLERELAENGKSEFRPRTEIQSLHLQEDGSVAAEVQTPAGGAWIEARTAIVALGGRQIVSDTPDLEFSPSVTMKDVDPSKIIPSDTLFTAEGFARAMAILSTASRPSVTILGGRHSAFSAGWLLTTRCPQAGFGPGDITILCRRPAPIFYASREAAIADGYDVTARSLCPKTGRVNRFGGLRGDGRELLRRVSQCPGTEPETRIHVGRLADAAGSPYTLRHALNAAALVVPAFGYRAATIPIFDPQGRRLALNADHGGAAVGRDARLLLAGGGSLPNVFGIGLGTGYQPWGHMGGEADIEGQTNSLWLYQNHIGEVVYRGVQECLRTGKPRSFALDDMAPARQ